MQQIIESHLDTLMRPSDAGASPTENSTDTVDSFTDTRNALILLMFYSTGLRLSELIGLMDADVDTARGELKVLGKRNKERLIPFGTELADAIGAYRLRRNAEGATSPTGRFFTRPDGSDLYPTLVQRLVKKSCRATPTPRACRPTRCATASPPTCSTTEPTSAACRNFSATNRFRLRRSTPT